MSSLAGIALAAGILGLFALPFVVEWRLRKREERAGLHLGEQRLPEGWHEWPGMVFQQTLEDILDSATFDFPARPPAHPAVIHRYSKHHNRVPHLYDQETDLYVGENYQVQARSALSLIPPGPETLVIQLPR